MSNPQPPVPGTMRRVDTLDSAVQTDEDSDTYIVVPSEGRVTAIPLTPAAWHRDAG